MVMPSLCLTHNSAHFNTDRARRILSAEAHHHNTILLCFVVGCMNQNREGCVIQDIYNGGSVFLMPSFLYNVFLGNSLAFLSLPTEQLPQSNLEFANLTDRIVLRLLKRYKAMISYI
jgi:hypothetical protein